MSLLPRSLIFCAISLCALARGNEPYPIVDKSVQQARDVDRRAILEAELVAEQHDLGAAREAIEKAPSDEARSQVHRHEENIKALQRELARVSKETPVRVTASSAKPNAAVAGKRTAPGPTRAPFWDVYRRSTSPTDF